MQRIKLSLILGAATLCALLVPAQTSPVDRFERGLRSHPGDHKQFIAGAAGPSLGPEVRVFYIHGVQYWATIGEEALLSGPDWTPSKPLPLDFTKVEGIARQELRRLISEDSTWEVAGFHLRSVRVGALDIDDLRRSLSSAPKWYLQVEMRPVSGNRPEGGGQPADSFWVFIDLAGEAGKIQVHKEP